MERPFFKYKIDDLQREFADRLDDLSFLELLAHELTFRSTVAARRLQQEVNDRIAELKKRAMSTPVASGARAKAVVEGKQEKVVSPPRPDKWPANLIAGWLALEVLSPQTYRRVEDLADGDSRRMADLGRRPLPWERREPSRENYRLYYQVLLGAIRMQEATAALLQRYADSSPEFRTQIGMCPIAVVMLDQQGRLVEDRPVSIASFAWGWRVAMEGRLADLAQWSTVESKLCEDLAEHLTRRGENGEVFPLDVATIRSAFDFICLKLRLDPGIVEQPRYAVRTYQWFTLKTPPDPIILNSFFLEDLAWAKEEVGNNNASAPLRQFVSVARKEPPNDLLTSPSALEAAVRPSMYALARWPSPGRHPLVLMQQAAVNLAIHELRSSEALFAVNGPPGTGKTTLLRDICAAIVTERACRLVEFEDPASAFEITRVSLTVSGSKTALYRVDERIRGFEIAVASTNNRAVENVSRELPELRAIADDATDLRYFPSVSDHLSGEDDSTWGLFAAVLGNQSNVSTFKNALRHDDRGLLAYLAACAGVTAVVTGTSSETDIEPRTPVVVQRERPPRSRQEALKRWQDARVRFRAAVEAVQSAVEKGSHLRGLCLELDRREMELKRRVSEMQARRKAFDEARTAQERAARRAEDLTTRVRSAEDVLNAHNAICPAWWRRFLRLPDTREWRQEHKTYKKELIGLRAQLSAARSASEESRKRSSASKAALDVAEKSAQAAQAAFDGLKSDIERTAKSEGVSVISPNMIEAATDEIERGRIQKLSPWFGENTQRSRDNLFSAAMHLHRAFVDAAAGPIRNNLAALFGMASLETKERLPLVPYLWSTLFLVVPVVSTTFASVRKLFRLLPQESLGWLLIDEAGQATPQAAVGALMRCRRAIVVGDPLQIEPVTSLPVRLIQAICDFYSVERERWTAPTSSVQTLADAVNKYASTIEQVDGSKKVGVPLLVHRRCQSPMFDISNRVAYGGKMIQATPPAAERSHPVLGPSRWINVRGASNNKWSEDEGRVVSDALNALFAAERVAMPDVFIISPFRNVAYQLRKLLPQSVVTGLGANAHQWWSERIGTIHTFQGKQAQIVFLVLGASGAQEGGARNWAAGTPNIVNVAASRAKDFFYVVGDASAWAGIGAMRVLRAYLRVDEAPGLVHVGLGDRRLI